MLRSTVPTVMDGHDRLLNATEVWPDAVVKVSCQKQGEIFPTYIGTMNRVLMDDRGWCLGDYIDLIVPIKRGGTEDVEQRADRVFISGITAIDILAPDFERWKQGNLHFKYELLKSYEPHLALLPKN